jgi:hypothetical protein
MPWNAVQYSLPVVVTRQSFRAGLDGLDDPDQLGPAVGEAFTQGLDIGNLLPEHVQQFVLVPGAELVGSRLRISCSENPAFWALVMMSSVTTASVLYSR